MAPASPGGVLVQRVGSIYYAYTFSSDGVRVADATSLPGLDPSVSNNLNPVLATGLPGGYQPTLSDIWITYWDGTSIYLVNASSPLPASALSALKFTKASFGRTADRLVSFSAAQDPANPVAVYLLGEFATGTKHGGWTLMRVQGGTPTVVGSLPADAGAGFTYVNSFASDSTGNLFAFMWERTSTGVPRLYTSSVSASTFVASAPLDVTASGFSMGRPAYVAGTTAGQIYGYSPSGATGWILPMSCGK